MEKSMIKILKALNDSNAYSSNYLLSAFETVASRTIKTSGKLPANELEQFVLNSGNSPRVRRIVYEWLLKDDPELKNRLIPKMLKDPSAEFRRDAVARLIIKGEKEQADEKNKEAIATFQKAFTGAVDEDQVSQISDNLKKMGVNTNLQKHFGILASWNIIGPFENGDGVGYDAVYSPEKEIDFSKSYPGQKEEIKWQQISTEDDHGIVDIGADIENYKGSVMYVAFEFKSDQTRDVVLKFGTPNAWKIWINGELTSSLEEYHRGTQFDQHKIPARIRSGKNMILLKICQNEQKESWAQKYQFQIRVCDLTGSAIHPSK